MITPLVIVALVVVPYLVLRAWPPPRGAARAPGHARGELGAAAGLAFAFAFFGIGHFVQTASMVEMLPPWVPQRRELILATGVLEWLLAAGLAVPRTRAAAAWACIAVLVAFFPANVYAAINRVAMGGHAWGPVYLLIRAPLQAFLIGWAYWLVARRS